jgi:hypothetical protein
MQAKACPASEASALGMIFTGPSHRSHLVMSRRNTRFSLRAQVIARDGMYAGFAGAKTGHGGMLFHRGAVIRCVGRVFA